MFQNILCVQDLQPWAHFIDFSFLLQGKSHYQPTNVETQQAQEFDSA